MSRKPTTPIGRITPATALAEAGLGLRARNKLRTRKAIREAAYRLIEDRGYDSTTIEQIAAAAEVSPSTVFRYFPSKEHIIVTDDFAAPVIELLATRPADEPPLVALREAMAGATRLVSAEFEADYRRRLELAREVPALRRQMYESQGTLVEALSVALAGQRGLLAEDRRLRIVVGAVIGALTQALISWGDHGQEGGLVESIDQALAVLEGGLTL